MIKPNLTLTRESEMKKLFALTVAALVLGLTLIAGLSAQETEQKSGEGMPEMGPPQQIKDMAFMVGDWTFTGRLRMDPQSEWMPNEAMVKFSYVAGGAALQMEFTGMMMGMEMHGLSLTAYDRELEQWQDTWVDNFGGRISFYTGKDLDGKRVVSGEDYSGGQMVYSRTTTYDVTDTEFKWTMENSLDGENWYVSMEGVYTKNK